MTYFTDENTDGFTQSQMDMLNRVAAKLAADLDNVEVYSITDRIGNQWRDGITEDDLETEVCAALSAA